MPYKLSKESDLARCGITIFADDTKDPAHSLSGMTGDFTHASFLPENGAAFFDMRGKTATLDERPWGLLCQVVSTTDRVFKETSREGGTASSNETTRQRISTLKLVQPLTLCMRIDTPEESADSYSASDDQHRDIVLCIRSLGQDEGDIDFEETCGTSQRRINRHPSTTFDILPPVGVEAYHAFHAIAQRVLQATGPDSEDTCQIHGYANVGGSMLLVAPAQSRYRLDDGRTLLLGGKLRQDGDRSTTYDSLIIKSYLVDSAKMSDSQEDQDSDDSDVTVTAEEAGGKGRP